MVARIPLVVLLALVLLSGCTPLGENIARRPASGSGQASESSFAFHTGTHAPGSTLDPVTRQTILEYGPVIRESALRYGFDWRLILALMKQESGFEADAESPRGASGLMQVMPVTQREVLDRIALDDTTDASANIRIGVYYLKTLYSMFPGINETDRLKLALAAYNAGLGRVHDAQKVAAYLGDNPGRWRAVRASLPLLSQRFSSLHRHIWSDDQPRNGWFGDARQTVAYVDGVIAQYETYVRELI